MGKANGATFYPVHPNYETVLGHPVYKSIFDIPGDIDLAIILTGKAVDTFEEVLARKAKFAVIFAAGFSETGKEGEKLEARLDKLVEGGDVRLLGPNTNLNAFETFRDDLEGPSIALVTQSGHQGRPVFQGQELGIRLTHWAPTGNEVDLEFADFARYFADQEEVGVVACYIEGFKDGRTLMLAADHAAKLQKPIVMVKVGRTETGSSMAQSHTGHLTGSDAITDAVFRQLGVTRVDGLDELLEVVRVLRAHPAGGRARVGEEDGRAGRVRLRDLRRHRRAHGRHARRRGPAPPAARQGDPEGPARRAHPRVPAGEQPGRLRRPAGRRRRAAVRSSTRSSPTRRPTSSWCRSPARSCCSASRSPATSSTSRRPPTSRSSWCGDRLREPTTRTTSACSTAGCRCSARSATA